MKNTNDEQKITSNYEPFKEIPIFVESELTRTLFPEILPLFTREEVDYSGKMTGRILGEVIKHPGQKIRFDETCRNVLVESLAFNVRKEVKDKDLPEGFALSDFSYRHPELENYEDTCNKIFAVLKQKCGVEIPLAGEGTKVDDENLENLFDREINNFSPEMNAKAVHEISMLKNPGLKTIFLFRKDSIISWGNPGYSRDLERENWLFTRIFPSVRENLKKEFGQELLLVDNFDFYKEGDTHSHLILGYYGREQGSSGDESYERTRDYHNFRHSHPTQITYWSLWDEFHNGQKDKLPKMLYGKTVIEEVRKLFLK